METISTLALWKVERLGEMPLYSGSFQMGIWFWSLHICRNPNKSSLLDIKLVCDRSRGTECLWPNAELKFWYNIIGPNRQSPKFEVTEYAFTEGGHFTWSMPEPEGKFNIGVEFVDLEIRVDDDKTVLGMLEGLKYSPWEFIVQESSQVRLSRMFEEAILTDIRIVLSDGESVVAHKAFLATISNYFSNKINDQPNDEDDVIEINDISTDSFKILLKSLYGIIEHGDLIRHGKELMDGVEKYEIEHFLSEEKYGIKYLMNLASSIRDGDKLLSIIEKSSTMRLSRLFYDTRLCDLKVLLKDENERVIMIECAHRAIFATTFIQLRSTFDQDVADNRASEVVFKNTSRESLMFLLHYLYGRTGNQDPLKVIDELLTLATMSDCIDLRDSLEKRLIADINNENVLNHLSLAWRYQLGNLKKGCFAFLLNFGRILHMTGAVADFLAKTSSENATEFIEEMVQFSGL